MLTFHYEPETTGAAAALTARLTEELQSAESVLWLVPGGSNIALSTAVMRDLPEPLLPRLSCLLTDERYGVPGHADSNWQQLAEAGFMDRGVRFPATLIPDMTLSDTCLQYAELAARELTAADRVVAQFGIGGDGHIAGILPRTPAVTSTDLATGYDSANFQRITLTPVALRQVHVAYAFVYGQTKLEALQRLQSQDLPLDEQPSQILKELPESHLYTDQDLEAAR